VVGCPVGSRLPAGCRYVLWLDPGLITGWALYYVDDQKIVLDQYEFDELCWRLANWCKTTGSTTVVGVERFALTSKSWPYKDAYSALYAIGAAKSAASRHGALRFLDGQTSSAGLALGTDEVLRTCGWYSTILPHGNDAARHIGSYLSSVDCAPSAWTDSIRTLLENQEN
jgi:hypothetical protein